jgi:hypothetical protein
MNTRGCILKESLSSISHTNVEIKRSTHFTIHSLSYHIIKMPEIIDQVFAKTSPKRPFSMTEYERFWLVFTKTRVYKFGHRNETKKAIFGA